MLLKAGQTLIRVQHELYLQRPFAKLPSPTLQGEGDKAEGLQGPPHHQVILASLPAWALPGCPYAVAPALHRDGCLCCLAAAGLDPYAFEMQMCAPLLLLCWRMVARARL